MLKSPETESHGCTNQLLLVACRGIQLQPEAEKKSTLTNRIINRRKKRVFRLYIATVKVSTLCG